MSDLIRWLCLYAQENLMGALWSDGEYQTCLQAAEACVDRLERQLDPEGKKTLRELMDQSAFQSGLEQEYLFRAALSMARELGEELQPPHSQMAVAK